MTTRCWHASSLISMWHGAFTNGDQPVTWWQNVDYTEPLPSWECQEFMLLGTNMYYWNGLVFYAGKSPLNITTWGLRGGLISPGVGRAGPETQEMWEWGQNCGTHWLCSSHTPRSWPEADGLVEHSQGPARQHSQQLRGADHSCPRGRTVFQGGSCSPAFPLWSRPNQTLPETTFLPGSFPFFFLFLETWEILVLQPGIEPMLPAAEAWSLNHWTAREVPLPLYLASFPPLKAFPGEMLFHQQIMVHWILFSGSALWEPNKRQPPHPHQNMLLREAASGNETMPAQATKEAEFLLLTKDLLSLVLSN